MSLGNLAQMQPGSTFGLAVLPLYLLFLALPGLVFVKTFIFADRRPDTLDRYDKLGYLLIGGVFSSIILLGGWRASGNGVILGDQLGNFSLLAILTAVLLQSSVAGVLGLVLGVLRYSFGDSILEWSRQKLRRVTRDVGRKFNDRQEPWEYVIENIREQEVKVNLTDGTSITGYVARFSSGPSRRTLALSPIEPDRRTEIGPDDLRTNAVYIHDSDISHIWFRDTETEDEYSDVLVIGDVEPPDEESAEGK